MIMKNNVSSDLPKEKIDEVLGHLSAIYAALPFLQGLNANDRLRMNKAGDASQAFTRKSLDVAPLVIDYLPRGIEIDELRKDIEVMDGLQTLMVATSQLSEMISDTHAIASSEAYSTALEVYAAAKKGRGEIGMDEMVKELGRRFARSSSSTQAPTDASTDPPTGTSTDPPTGTFPRVPTEAPSEAQPRAKAE